ncbi:Ribonuclease P Protein Subunit P21 [Manis pentadactyla]|nr:Ribonuclease P Protein Subunit P21 [Manis pentadactyla]
MTDVEADGVGSDKVAMAGELGDCAIQFQDCECWVISILMVEFQAKGGLSSAGFWATIWFVVQKDLWNIELHLVIASDPDVRAMARFASATDRHVRRLVSQCRFRFIFTSWCGIGDISADAEAG